MTPGLCFSSSVVLRGVEAALIRWRTEEGSWRSPSRTRWTRYETNTDGCTHYISDKISARCSKDWCPPPTPHQPPTHPMSMNHLESSFVWCLLHIHITFLFGSKWLRFRQRSVNKPNQIFSVSLFYIIINCIGLWETAFWTVDRPKN